MKKLLLTIALSILSLSAHSQECELKYKAPTDIATCYEKESFARVQSNYQKLFNASKEQLSYNKDILINLNKSQKAWLFYRDSYCDTYTNYHGEANNHANCIIHLNDERSKQLKSDIDGVIIGASS